MTGLQLGTTATAGHVLTTDASGIGTWQPAAGVGFWTDVGTHIHANNSPNVVVTDVGHVGIGDTTPDSKLDVEGGDIRISTAGRGLIVRGVLLSESRSVNLGEDWYGMWLPWGGSPDTCDFCINTTFRCNETDSMSCTDVFEWNATQRQVHCRHNRILSVY